MLYAYRIILPRHLTQQSCCILSSSSSHHPLNTFHIHNQIWSLEHRNFSSNFSILCTKCARLAVIICNLIKLWLTNDNQNSISLRVVHCRLPGWPQLHFLSAVVILENHSFSLCLITAIICEFYCPQSCSSILVTRTRSALSHKKWVFCLWISYVLAGSPKKLHFCSDLGRRFDGPGRYRRIGMTGEVCTELRVASAPKQQHGERGERTNICIICNMHV